MNHSTKLFPACIRGDKGELYGVTHVERIIEKIDLRDYTVECLDPPKGYDLREWSGADKLIFNDGALYLFEQNGERVLEYNLSTKAGRCFAVNNNVHLWTNWAAGLIYEGILYIFPSFANRLIKVHLDSGRIENREKLCPDVTYLFNQEKVRSIYNGKEVENPHRLFSCGCQTGTQVWLFAERKQFVIRYDLSKDEFKQYPLPEDIKGCIHAVYKNDVFYILSSEGNVYSWKAANREGKELFDCRGKYPEPYFGKIVVTDANIWMIPAQGDDICIIGLSEEGTGVYRGYPEDFCYCDDLNRSRYYGYCEDEGNCYFAMHSANYILMIEKATGKGKWIKPQEPTLEEKWDYYERNGYEYEYSDKYGVEYLILSCLKKESVFSAKQSDIGNSIWNMMRAEKL